MTDKDIIPVNEEGKLHGYCEKYWITGQLLRKGVYANGKLYGYYEWCHRDGVIDKDWSGYFLGGIKVSDTNKEGYCLIWLKVIVV